MTELARFEPGSESAIAQVGQDHRAGVVALAMMPQAEFEQRLAQLRAGQERLAMIHRELMHPEVDYGIIPGTKNPTLLKPGAEKLCQFYGLCPEFVDKVSYGDGETAPHITVESTCVLRLGSLSGLAVAMGRGAATSWETRYRYRRGERSCPGCGCVGTVIKGKQEYGGGWICFAKKGGCGAKYGEGDPQITEQVVGNVENPDPFDLLNTLIKMGKKRSHVDAVLTATATSGLYTQDMEDMAPREEAPDAETPGQPPNGSGQQRASRAVQGAERQNGYASAPGTNNLKCSWHGCDAALTKGQHDVSVRAFQRPLCPDHQRATKAGAEEHPMQSPAPAATKPATAAAAPAPAPASAPQPDARQTAMKRLFASYSAACERESVESSDDLMRRHIELVLTQAAGSPVQIASRADLTFDELVACAEYFDAQGIPAETWGESETEDDPFQEE
jgi:hypothetical protein